jgi:hypothetical protein
MSKREKEREREPQSRCGWATRTIRTHSSDCSQIAVRAIGDEIGCAKDEDWDEGCAAGMESVSCLSLFKRHAEHHCNCSK